MRSVPLVIAAFVAIWGRQGSDRAPPRGAPLREHGGTDGRILQRDHAENRDGEIFVRTIDLTLATF